MNRRMAARVLLGVAKELVAGQRVNPKYLEFNGEVPITRMIKEMEELRDVLEVWRQSGVKTVKGFGSEWIPYW